MESITVLPAEARMKYKLIYKHSGVLDEVVVIVNRNLTVSKVSDDYYKAFLNKPVGRLLYFCQSYSDVEVTTEHLFTKEVKTTIAKKLSKGLNSHIPDRIVFID